MTDNLMLHGFVATPSPATRFKTLLLCGAAAVLVLAAAVGASDVLYPQPDINPGAGYAADAMATTVAVAPPIGFIGFCLQNLDECVKRGEPSAVVPFNADRQRELDDTQWSMNHSIAPRENAQHLWEYPVHDGGDCNTYALAKRRALIALGWPASSLLLTAAMTERNEAHLVLVARTDAGDFVLDNRSARVVDWKALPYRWLEREDADDPTRWVGIASNRIASSLP